MNSTTQFLQSLFAAYARDENLTIEIRHKRLADDETSQRWFSIDRLESAADYAREIAPMEEAWFGVLPRMGRGGRVHHVPCAAYVWADVDAGRDDFEAVCERIKSAGLPPTRWKVYSGSGGMHLYWPLPDALPFTSDVDRELFKSVLRRIALKIGGKAPHCHGDAAVADVARVMRIPNTFNHKHDPPVKTRGFFNEAAQPVSFFWWEANLPKEPTIKDPNTIPRKNEDYKAKTKLESGAPLWAVEMSSQPMMAGERHNRLKWYATRMIRGFDVDRDTAFTLCRRRADISGGPPMSDKEIADLIKWA